MAKVTKSIEKAIGGIESPIGDETALPATTPRKAYRARVGVYTKAGEHRSAGAPVFDDEVENGLDLVERGILLDPDAPVAPSLAGKIAVHKELIGLAIDGRVIERKHATSFVFGGKSIEASSVDDLMQSISVEAVRAAITARLRNDVTAI